MSNEQWKKKTRRTRGGKKGVGKKSTETFLSARPPDKYFGQRRYTRRYYFVTIPSVYPLEK